MEIDSFTLLAYRPPLVSFRVLCSKGTYVRSLAADVGRDLGCGARIWSLRREASGPFTLAQACPLDELIEKVEAGESLPLLSPLEVLSHLPRLVIAESGIKERIAHGMPVSLGEISASLPVLAAKAEVVLVDEAGTLLAVARLSRDESRPDEGAEELRMSRVMMPQNS